LPGTVAPSYQGGRDLKDPSSRPGQKVSKTSSQHISWTGLCALMVPATWEAVWSQPGSQTKKYPKGKDKRHGSSGRGPTSKLEVLSSNPTTAKTSLKIKISSLKQYI
jgi:hypothetical protein